MRGRTKVCNQRLALVSIFALLCYGECVEMGLRKHSRVKVTAFSIIGDRIQNLDIDLVEVGTKRSWRSASHHATAKVPFGTYTLSVRAMGFRAIQHELRVDQADVVIREELPITIECGGFGKLCGTVQSGPVGRELWVKLLPGVGSVGAEGNLDLEKR